MGTLDGGPPIAANEAHLLAAQQRFKATTEQHSWNARLFSSKFFSFRRAHTQKEVEDHSSSRRENIESGRRKSVKIPPVALLEDSQQQAEAIGARWRHILARLDDDQERGGGGGQQAKCRVDTGPPPLVTVHRRCSLARVVEALVCHFV
jgi:hypothetical protein